MKKQETVEKNFQKTITQWEEARDRKIQNIRKAQKEIAVKSRKLQEEYTRLEAEVQRLKKSVAPSAPSLDQRLEARAKVRELHLEG